MRRLITLAALVLSIALPASAQLIQQTAPIVIPPFTSQSFTSLALSGNLTFTGTSSAGVVLRSVTTTQRDGISSPAAGSILYNSTTSRPNYYDGSAWVGVAKVLTVNTTSVGTDANTNEKDLWTYSLPANVLNADGKTIRVTVVVDTAANINNKTYRVYFGSTVIATVVGTFNNAQTTVQALVWRTGAATQVASGWGLVNGSTSQRVFTSTPTENTANAITIKVTGQNGTAVANDIVFKASIVEAVN